MLLRPVESAQYITHAVIGLCFKRHIVQSMTRVGSCHDNTAAESWFATLRTELVYRVALPTKGYARRRIIGRIDRYNRTRRHSHCGLKSPLAYERLHTPAATAAA